MDKFIYFIRPIISFVGLVPTTLYIILHPNDGPLDMTMQKIAYSLTAYLGILMQYQSMVCRPEASQLLILLNRMSQNHLRRSDHPKYRPQRNRIYLIVLMIPVSVVVLALVPLPILISAFRNGEQYFKNGIPFGETPFSLASYVQAIFYYMTFVYIYWYCMPYYGLILENFLQVVLNFKILADDLRVLRKGKVTSEELEYEKLRQFMIVFSDLKM